MEWPKELLPPECTCPKPLECTCAAPDCGVGIIHEPGCGHEEGCPVIDWQARSLEEILRGGIDTDPFGKGGG